MEESLRFGAVEVRPAQRQVLVDGQPAALGARPFDLLLMLLEHRDRVVTKDELIGKVWAGLVVEENNLQVQISALRKLLGVGAIATVPARGYRFVAVPDRLGAAEAGPPAGPGLEPGLAAPLPRLRTRFFGRERERKRALAHLRDGALLTLTGIGGSGKTRLALELAREAQATQTAQAAQAAQADFPDGVAFIDLAAVGDGQDVGAIVANGLGIRELPGTPVLQLLLERLRTSRLLLVLDNCEHLIEPVTALVEALLDRCAALRVLVTSREALGVAGEQVQPVGALALAGPEDIAALEACDAVQLFVDRARLVAPDFQVTSGNAAALHEVCRRLDGIPLALELAAARLNVLSVEQLKARLDDRFRLLAGGRRALPRQQTLDGVVRWSYEHLSEPEQRLLQRLSVFSGGSTIEAAVYVCEGEAAEHEVIEQLSSLAQKSLIGLTEGAAQPRHLMLETVRLFALERLDESGQAGVARDRHLAFFAQWAEALRKHADTKVRSGADAVLDAERDNLIAALRYGADGGAADTAWRLAEGLGGYWGHCGLYEVGYALLEAMFAATQASLQGVARVKALQALQARAVDVGQWQRTLSLANEQLELARTLGDRNAEFSALSGSVTAALALGEAARAWSHIEAMEALSAHLPERVPILWHYKAVSLHALGRLDEAEPLYLQALQEAVAGGHPGRVINKTVNLALLSLARPDVEGARRWLERAIEARTRSDQGVYGMGHILLIAAALHAAGGGWEAAARLHGAAEAHLRRTGQRMEPIDMAPLEPFLAQARTAISAEQHAQAFEAGGALDPEAVLKLAADCLPRAAAGPAERNQ
jgi:non-specific serine/threonine protein kinase